MVKCYYACGESLNSTYYAFCSRTQKVAQVDGQTTISVMSELQELQFCSQRCWQTLEPRIIDGLNPVYQPFHMVATCSQCQRAAGIWRCRRGCGIKISCFATTFSADIHANWGGAERTRAPERPCTVATGSSSQDCRTAFKPGNRCRGDFDEDWTTTM